MMNNYRKEASLNSKLKSFKEFVYRFSKSWGGIIEIIIFVLLFVLAFIVPFFIQDLTSLDHKNKLLSLFNDRPFFGTDSSGRGWWAQLWHGLRFSTLIAISETFIDVLVGEILMGYFDMFDRILKFIIVGTLVISGLIGTGNQVRIKFKELETLNEF